MTQNQSNRFTESLKRYADILTDDEIQSLLRVMNDPPTTGIYLNRLKGNPQKRINQLCKLYKWEVTPLPFCDHCWTLETPDQSPGTTIEHRMGNYYLQDPASMLPVSLFNLKQSYPLILDMAASPGGKTTHLIDKTADHGFIIANDASKSRIPTLRSVLSSWGGINQIITHYPGESFGSWFPEVFDYILLDAPCSMENFRPTDSHPMREITQAERQRLQERQIQLLKSGLSALKIGGQLVYATCSLAPEEDEAVINALFSAFPGTFRVEDITHMSNIAAPGLLNFGSKLFHPDTKHALRIWPHQTGMSGFFSALITKHAPVQFPQLDPPHRDFDRTGLATLDRRSKDQVFEQMENQFGFNMENLLAASRIEVFRRLDQLFLIPHQYLHNFISMPYEYIGMPLGRWLKGQLEPSHVFISRFGHLFSKGKLVLKQEFVKQWISGRDIRNPDFKQEIKNQYLLVTDTLGRNLGLGKLLPNRLRNMLPR